MFTAIVEREGWWNTADPSRSEELKMLYGITMDRRAEELLSKTVFECMKGDFPSEAVIISSSELLGKQRTVHSLHEIRVAAMQRGLAAPYPMLARQMIVRCIEQKFYGVSSFVCPHNPVILSDSVPYIIQAEVCPYNASLGIVSKPYDHDGLGRFRSRSIRWRSEIPLYETACCITLNAY
jgi:hypothetical protein